MSCCSRPRMKLVGTNTKGRVYQCQNCGRQDPEFEPYEPEIGQAVFGNPTSEFKFSSMPDYWVIQHMLLLIEHYAGVGFKNDVFEINPYYWGDDDEEAEKPNFKHYNSGLEIRWYKYIGRGMSCNQHVCPDCFWNIFAECMNSLGL